MMRLLRCSTCLFLAGVAWCQIRPLQKSASATTKVPLFDGRWALWINPAEWKVTGASAPVLVLEHKAGTRVEVNSGAAALTSAEVKRAVLAKLRQVDADAEELNSEAQTVNGREILVAEFSYQDRDGPHKLLGGYYGGDGGALRVEFRTMKHIVGASRRAFLQLLTGLQIGGPGI